MKKKIFRSVVFTTCISLLVGFSLLLSVLYVHFSETRMEQLRVQLDFAAEAVEEMGEPYLIATDNAVFRLTWIAQDGTVLWDTAVDAAAMPNHNDRAEVEAAKSAGYGEASRVSATLLEKTDYAAKKLSDGTVLRISANHETVLRLLLQMAVPFALLFFGLGVLASVFAKRLSKSVVRPLYAISFDRPLETEPYPELSPILRHIDAQNRRLQAKAEQLERLQTEFSTITADMSEGLVLLNADGAVVHINSAAKRLYGLTENPIGSDFLTVDRRVEATQCVKKALSGENASCTLEQNGGFYLLRCTAILNDGVIGGAVLLLLDVTQQHNAQKTRQEFSANVSHELKTPLQSIIGSAQLLESGLVKPEDTARFIGHIKTDAARLVDMVNDIIRLSRLDEQTDFARETVELAAVIEEVRSALLPAAEAHGVTLRTEAPPICLQSVRRLLYEILFNLCDNAIRYNRTGGQVFVAAEQRAECLQITVRDTGIGISAEDLPRIFERFFRADKSHTRTSGGTGLGLSIVKHAVQTLGGEISVESVLQSGTCFSVTFPVKS